MLYHRSPERHRHPFVVRAEVTGADPEEIMRYLQRDKKRRSGTVPFVLVRAPGDVTPGHQVPEADLRAAVEEACAA